MKQDDQSNTKHNFRKYHLRDQFDTLTLFFSK